jgi:anti-sigma-K factor RskA
MSDSHERYENDLAPHLLGALDPGEARTLEAHLEECAHCRAELERMRLAVDVLPRSVVQFSPPPSLKAELMEVVEREAAGGDAEPARSRRLRSLRARLDPALVRIRPATAWASAAFLLFVGILTGVGASQLAGSDPRVVSASVDEQRVPFANASLVVHDEEDSDGAVLRVHGMPTLSSDRVYQLWVQRGDEVVPGALFSVGDNGTGSTAVTESLENADAVMVTREPNGGARAPSEEPLLTVEL